MTNQRTKKVRCLKLLFLSLSVLLSFGPVCIYSVIALSSNTGEMNKYILSSLLCVSVILSAVAVIKSYMPRCSLWLIIIGLFICLDNIIGCVIIIAITQVLDELIVHPLYKHYKIALIANKEMDLRG